MDKNRNDTLTVTQKMIIEFLGNYAAEYGYSPTIREICAGVGLKSTASVHAALNRLEEMGIIENGKPGAARSVRLNESYSGNGKFNRTGIRYYFPCRLGSSVWVFVNDLIKAYTVVSYAVSETATTVSLKEKAGRQYIRVPVSQFGKTVFTSQEKAVRFYEKKLEEEWKNDSSDRN